MTAVGLISLAVGSATPQPNAPKVDLSKDPAVRNALLVINACLSDWGPSKDGAILQQQPKGYYFLWTLERMAVIYDFKKIAGKDWHQWGAEMLLAKQQEDGSWKGEYHEGGCDTCFALLFLVKANVARDLTVKVKDKLPTDLLDLMGRDVSDKKPPKKTPLPEAPEPESDPLPPEMTSAQLEPGAWATMQWSVFYAMRRPASHACCG
jgi:hypothetical protein